MKTVCSIFIIFFVGLCEAQSIEKLIEDSVFRFPFEKGKITYKISNEITKGSCEYEWSHHGWKDKRIRFLVFNAFGVEMSDSTIEERNLASFKKIDIKSNKELTQDLRVEVDLYRYKSSEEAKEIWMAKKANKIGVREILGKKVTVWSYTSGQLIESGEWNGIILYEKRKIGNITYTLEAIEILLTDKIN